MQAPSQAASPLLYLWARQGGTCTLASSLCFKFLLSPPTTPPGRPRASGSLLPAPVERGIQWIAEERLVLTSGPLLWVWKATAKRQTAHVGFSVFLCFHFSVCIFTLCFYLMVITSLWQVLMLTAGKEIGDLTQKDPLADEQKCSWKGLGARW